MIAVDTSTWIAFFEGDGGEGPERVVHNAAPVDRGPVPKD